MAANHTPPRYLIANADDFGWSEHTAEVTMHCFHEGVLSSATMMVNRPGFGCAAAFARKNPQYSYGLHICLVDEFPVSAPGDIPTLVDAAGRFYPTAVFLRRAFQGRIRAEDVQREIMAQVQCMQAAGVAPSHFDSHGHIHKVPVVARALLRLRNKTGVPRVRCMQDIFFQCRSGIVRGLYHQLVTRWLRSAYQTPAHFLMVTGRLTETETNWWGPCICALPSGVSEIGFHPGLAEEGWRTLETRDVLRTGRSMLQRAGVDLIPYHDVRVV